ncbi:alpha/beta fold hydrolase [Streptomyces sp. NBC_00151]|jgi:pimeloyl-ACP methyl ester carboxylesterase|uniref:alpha/beta fold hydrolase n=1 Tax=Streptomyces sp. NBC_00151 TaxID=2975669 RepID=UPI002DDBBD59|nr:alpha/beta hydrolase [Streptomyces sp. NBC_00151]WRZ36853.1 alpha/beta hydrolase [Streptomyces sp. NBC_00151]WRZ44725.1 alpha/beta hydrolase [Streptomyces sp. NBC_00151]
MTPPGLRVFDGDAASAAVVMVHGIRVSSSMWLPHARRLAPDFRVSAPDLPGHGALHGGTFTLAAAVEALDAAVAEADAATGRRPLVVGMSLGGFVAMAHAATRPGHLRGLLVCGSTARARGWKALAYTAAAHIDERRSEEHSTEANARLFRRHATPECAEAVIAGGFARHAFGEAVRELRRVDILDLAARLRTPIRFVNGRRDLLFRQEEKTFLRAVRAAGTAAHLAHAPGDHLFPLQDPDAFADLVRDFHTGLPAT